MAKTPHVGHRARPAAPIPPQYLPLLLLLAIIIGLQVATQAFAYKFAWHESLGAALTGHLYAPWDILRWALAWHSIYPEQLGSAAQLGAITAMVTLIVPVAIVGQMRSRVADVLHGSARWAKRKDIKDAGLLAEEGVIVGGWREGGAKMRWLRHSGPEHVLLYAPTRSGKGVGMVIPTLLEWQPSAVIADLKGELWPLTAGWRKTHAHNKVLRFEPASLRDTVRWNPLDEIRVGTEFEVGDAQNLATLIVDPDGKGFVDHWQKTAFALLTGVILYALAVRPGNQPATLAAIDVLLSDPKRPIKDLWNEMLNSKNAIIAQAAKDMLDRPPEEAGSVLSTAKSYLALYRDPVIQANTACSDFRIRDLMHHDSPVSLYIITKPTDKTRLRPLVRVLINMIVRLSASEMKFENGHPVAHYKHRLLLMLDEFPSLGKLDILQESLAFLAGYGIKAYLICQDINQLKSRENGYGQDEAITSNCHVQAALPPNRIETAEYLSRLTGQTTVIKEQVTVSGDRMAAFQSHISRTQQEIQRNLLTPDECLRLPGPKKDGEGRITKPGDMIIYAAGYPAIYGQQPLYFKDKTFLARAQIPAPASDRLTPPPPPASVRVGFTPEQEQQPAASTAPPANGLTVQFAPIDFTAAAQAQNSESATS
ncbi:MAG: type IV secretory system conjugative DNA transfer family protein [Rhodocyclaceae bacterium]|nr:type IV secretory system conjugative DNA transfer family protein [Rhodocyclaceae bacterium]